MLPESSHSEFVVSYTPGQNLTGRGGEYTIQAAQPFDNAAGGGGGNSLTDKLNDLPSDTTAVLQPGDGISFDPVTGESHLVAGAGDHLGADVIPITNATTVDPGYTYAVPADSTSAYALKYTETGAGGSNTAMFFPTPKGTSYSPGSSSGSSASGSTGDTGTSGGDNAIDSGYDGDSDAGNGDNAGNGSNAGNGNGDNAGNGSNAGNGNDNNAGNGNDNNAGNGNDNNAGNGNDNNAGNDFGPHDLLPDSRVDQIPAILDGLIDTALGSGLTGAQIAKKIATEIGLLIGFNGAGYLLGMGVAEAVKKLKGADKLDPLPTETASPYWKPFGTTPAGGGFTVNSPEMSNLISSWLDAIGQLETAKGTFTSAINALSAADFSDVKKSTGTSKTFDQLDEAKRAMQNHLKDLQANAEYVAKALTACKSDYHEQDSIVEKAFDVTSNWVAIPLLEFGGAGSQQSNLRMSA